MIPFDYKKIDAARKYPAYDYKLNGASKKLQPLVKQLQNCTEKAGVELHFANIGNDAVLIWKALDANEEGFEWWVLVSKDSKSIATLSDFKASDLKDRSSFVARCEKLKLIMTTLKAVANKAKKASSEYSSLGFDPVKVNKIYLKRFVNHKKLTPDELKLLVDACHKLVDMMAKKNPGILGLRVFEKLAEELDIPID